MKAWSNAGSHRTSFGGWIEGWNGVGGTSFVATKVCYVFVAIKVLLRQKYFVSTNIILPGQKFCRGKYTFVATKDVLCRDKPVFVATKMILVAAPANDKGEAGVGNFWGSLHCFPQI